MLLPVKDYVAIPIKFREEAERRGIPHRNTRLESSTLTRCRLCHKSAPNVRIDEYNLHIFKHHQVFANLLYYSTFTDWINTPQLKIHWQKENNQTLNKLKKWYTQVQRPECARALDEMMLEYEKVLKEPFIKEKENQYVARNAFTRMLIREEFQIKEEIGDPPAVAPGPLSDRNARRAKLIEFYRNKAKKANEPIIIDSQESTDPVIIVDEKPAKPKKRPKKVSAPTEPVVILDDSDEEQPPSTEMDTMDDDIPITKLLEKGANMVNKIEEKLSEETPKSNGPEIVLKDVNDNKDFFAVRNRPTLNCPSESSDSSSESEVEVAPVVPKFVSAYPDKASQSEAPKRKRLFEEPSPVVSNGVFDVNKPGTSKLTLPVHVNSGSNNLVKKPAKASKLSQRFASLEEDSNKKFADRGLDMSKSRLKELNPEKKIPSLKVYSETNPSSKDNSTENSSYKPMSISAVKNQKMKEKQGKIRAKREDGLIKVYSEPLGKDPRSMKKVMQHLNNGHNLWFLCPLSNKKIVTPVRGANCKHGSTFCYQQFKRKELNRPTCPLCSIKFDKNNPLKICSFTMSLMKDYPKFLQVRQINDGGLKTKIVGAKLADS